MKTQKRAASAPKTDAGKPEATQPPVEIVEPESREKTPRISFNLASDGTPDWDRMQPKTREQITDLLRNESVRKRLGITQEESKKIEELEFGDDEANALLDLLQNIDSMAASKIYSIPPEVTAEAFTFTLDHRKKISPPMKRVLNKWGPMILKTWKDEIGLGIVMISVLTSQVRMMHFLENRRKRSLAPTAVPQPKPKEPTPISTAPAPAPEQKKDEEQKDVEKAPSDVLENVGFTQAGD